MPRRSRSQRAAIERATRAQRLAGSAATIRSLTQPYAQRLQGHTLAGDFALTQLAQQLRRGVAWWWGERRDGSTNGAYCYLCSAYIATWDHRWPMPERASAEILDHRDRAHGSGAPNQRPATADHSAGG